MLKKSLALLLTLVMVLSLAPISAFAAETTSYDTVQIPQKMPLVYNKDTGEWERDEVVMDGYITQADGYHSFGIVADKAFTAIAKNSTSRNYAMLDVAKALNDAQTFTYFFAQDDTKYYFGIKLDRKSVNVNGYNYFSSQQDLTFNFDFGSYAKPVTIKLPVRYNVSIGTEEKNLTVSNDTIKAGFERGENEVGKAASYFNTEPAYNDYSVWDKTLYDNRVKADTRELSEGSTIGDNENKAAIIGASVFTYEFSITKDSVKKYLNVIEAPSSIYFSAASTTRYGSMNDLSLATRAAADSFDSTYSANIQFVSVDASSCEHEYVDNPIDSFLVNKSNWVAGQPDHKNASKYYHPVHPTSNTIAESRLRCDEAPEYYVSCRKCRAAGTKTFEGKLKKQHSFVIRGDIVSSEVTACNVENRSRITYEYKCAWCDKTEVLPLGDYIHDYKVTGSTITISRKYSTCQAQNCSKEYLMHSTTNHTEHTLGRTTNIDPTCTTPAVTVYECTDLVKTSNGTITSYCTYVKTVKTDDATGHNYESVVTPPTATEKGYTTHTCSNCGDSYKDNYVDADIVIENTGDDVATEEELKEIVSNVVVENREVEDYNSKAINNKEEVASAKVELRNAVEADGGTYDENAVKTEVAITLANIKVENKKATVLTFDVRPQVAIGNTSVKISSFATAITFQLPVGNTEGNIAKVYHEGEYLGTYVVQGSGVGRYVEVESDSFSEYSVELENGITTYEELVEALANNTEVKLDADITGPAESQIAISAGTTLDLNGKTLTVYMFASSGNVIDGAVGGEGKLVATRCYIATNNTYMPVYDGEGYRFYAFELDILSKTIEGETTKIRIGARIEFANEEAYTVIKNNDGAKLSVGLRFVVSGSDNASNFYYQNETLLGYAELEETVETGVPVLAVNVKGLDKIPEGTTINVYTTVSSTAGTLAVSDAAVALTGIINN